MKEISPGYYIFMVILCALFFFCGYKYGDSRGYDDGFQVGYQYDCRAELELLYNKVTAQSKILMFTDSAVKSVSRQNDSIKNWFVAESLQRVFAQDSLKNWKIAKKKNNDLKIRTGTSLSNVYSEDGRFNPLSCVVDTRLRSLDECREYRYLWESK